MGRVYNFSAGPAQLPMSVLKKAQMELLSFQGKGLSVMEMSHRSKVFTEIVEKTTALLRELMAIPDHYHILYIQGGASLQFSMVPLNLLKEDGLAYYIHTGTWSKKAMDEAKKVGKIQVIASSEEQKFTYIPSVDLSTLDKDANYLHITTNNTIEGTRFTSFPDTKEIPLVADMSSNILSEEIDVSRFGLIYAGAQKNLGIAGLTIVIIRDDLIHSNVENLPTMLKYQTYQKSRSLYNTPPTFAIYMTMLVLEWMKEHGGVKGIEINNRKKAQVFYQYLAESTLFFSNVRKEDRSLMTIPFFTKSDELNQLFIEEAERQGFIQLKGHRSVGGMRASMYNAMPLEGVQALVDFMKEFERKYT